MQLGLVLLSAIKISRLPYRFRGKYRIVKKPTMHDLLKMKIDFEREEQNMLILRHPYLTVEQSFGHKKALSNKDEKAHIKQFEKAKQKFSKQITFTDRLFSLGYGEQWD
ncbi:uncharacterized protein LOC116840796 [Odontomachus brunneus]|uniref:uncharacterized protein LOC116840796 n=1 Tax=Odontomachus brunneus TaxID=486640 RepID=UPI0013F18FB2|nr:uncharacterized protein LOC116840796 [Odontomachus brunneus]